MWHGQYALLLHTDLQSPVMPAEPLGFVAEWRDTSATVGNEGFWHLISNVVQETESWSKSPEQKSSLSGEFCLKYF